MAIIAGIFQLRIAKKNREIQEKQLEESRNQFFMQMEKSQKEYAEKIEQLREEQRKANLENANDKLQAETNRFYVGKCKELALYDTGVTAEYGDRLITLSTCEYSAQNGRLVVVAKKVG